VGFSPQAARPAWNGRRQGPMRSDRGIAATPIMVA